MDSLVKKVNLDISDTPFNNTRRFIDYGTRVTTDQAYTVIQQYVHPDKTKRDASKRLSEQIDAEMNELGSSQAIFRILAPDDFDPSLAINSKMDREMYDDVVCSMRRAGCHLSEATNKEVKEISDKILKMSSDFNQNLTEAKATVELDGDEILAMEQFCQDQSVSIPENNTLVLQGYGLYMKIIKFCPVESVRRKAYVAFCNTSKGNLKILEELQKLRTKRAQLLGYDNHAAFQLEINAIGSPEKALDFLRFFSENIGSKISQHQKLVCKTLDIDKADLMKVYNNSYYLERFRVVKHNVDAVKYMQYFEFETVLDMMIKVYEQFFEVSIQPATIQLLNDLEGKIWHDDVRTFTVKNADGRVLGTVHLDLFAREGKWSHPSQFPMIRRHEYLDGTTQLTTTALFTSFAKADGKTPTLLRHGQVETLFHEFGHVMHEILNEAKYATIGGISLTRDLVEVPSMYLEYLCWDPKFLRKLARHYKTDKPLTDAEINALVATKHVVPSFFFLKQLAYALYDLRFHMNEITVSDFMPHLYKISHLTGPQVASVASFGHLVGYDAQYYTYMFSQSYAAMLNAWLGGPTPKKANKAKYLEFLRHSNKEHLQNLLGENKPDTLIREIFSKH